MRNDQKSLMALRNQAKRRGITISGDRKIRIYRQDFRQMQPVAQVQEHGAFLPAIRSLGHARDGVLGRDQEVSALFARFRRLHLELYRGDISAEQALTEIESMLNWFIRRRRPNLRQTRSGLISDSDKLSVISLLERDNSIAACCKLLYRVLPPLGREPRMVGMAMALGEKAELLSQIYHLEKFKAERIVGKSDKVLSVFAKVATRKCKLTEAIIELQNLNRLLRGLWSPLCYLQLQRAAKLVHQLTEQYRSEAGCNLQVALNQLAVVQSLVDSHDAWLAQEHNQPVPENSDQIQLFAVS